MRYRALLTLPALVALAAGAPSASAGPGAAAGGRYIVTYQRSAGAVNAETDARERRDGFDATRRFHHVVRGFAARLSARQVAALRTDPEVASVTPDRPVSAASIPTGVRRIGAVNGTSTRGASSVGIAVIDTGIDLDHPDLDVKAGTSCTGSATPDDDNGHGTHVAGTIAGEGVEGVYGVAPGSDVYPVKVLDSGGSGWDSWVICGLDWVAQNAAAKNIRVANMSLGGDGTTSACGDHRDPLHEAVCRATAAGVTMAVAAGNDGRDFGADPVDTPAWFPEVLTVTAMSDGDGASGGARAPSCMGGESDDRFASFSNYATADTDAAHTIAAPGVCILSSVPGGGYGIGSGTSMASPHVAGEIALCLGENGAAGPCAGKTPAQIVSALRADAALAAYQGLGGFAGDPGDPFSPRFYGHLGRAPGATAPETEPDSPAPAQPTPPPTSTRQPVYVPPTVPTAGPSPAPPASRRCRLVNVRVTRVHRKVRWVLRHGRRHRVVKRIVRRRTVARLRCS